MTPPNKLPLTKEELIQFRLDQINNLPISAKAKAYLAETVKANIEADGSEGEGLDFALKHISKERLAIVTETAKVMHTIGQSITRRGRASLDALSNEEWDRLVNEAQKDDET